MSPEEFNRLRIEDPQELGRQLTRLRQSYSVAVQDHRQAFAYDEWGGEFRIMLNRNVVVHLVPSLNPEMDENKYLPQWTLFLDPSRGGESEVNKYEGLDGDDEPYWGVIWYLTASDYERIQRELAELYDGFGDFPVLPDGMIKDTLLHRVLEERVLEHPLVQNEATYNSCRFRF